MKFKRHNKILELIRSRDVEKQEEIMEYLRSSGFNVTQATVSRDIRELNITKVPAKDGKQKYTVMFSANALISEKFIRIFRDGVTSMECAQNIVVIKTLDGMAMAVAASLDAMENSQLVGTIAGDNTIFCVVKNDGQAKMLLRKLKAIIHS